MSKKKPFLYAIKYFKVNEDGTLSGPARDMEYKVREWHSRKTAVLCAVGFHFPTFSDIFNRNPEENNWYAHYNQRHYGDRIKTYLVKVSGVFDVSWDKIAASEIMLVREIKHDNMAQLKTQVRKLIKEYPGQTIYDIESKYREETKRYSKVLQKSTSGLYVIKEGR